MKGRTSLFFTFATNSAVHNEYWYLQRHPE